MKSVNIENNETAVKKTGRKLKPFDIVIRVAFVMFAVATIYFGVRQIQYMIESNEIKGEFDNIKQQIEDYMSGKITIPDTTFKAGETTNTTTATLPGVGGADTVKLPEFDANGFINSHKVLLNMNSDSAGWIEIPGTNNIHSPVLHYKDNEYYLTHSFNKNKGFHGSIFMDYRNNPQELDANTVIYGHNMRDGTMFAELIKYKDPAWAKKHRTVKYETHYVKYTAEIFAAYIIVPGNDILYPVNFSSEKKRGEFIKKVTDRSLVDFGVTVKEGQKMLELSTCDYTGKGSRMIIHAAITSETKAD